MLSGADLAVVVCQHIFSLHFGFYLEYRPVVGQVSYHPVTHHACRPIILRWVRVFSWSVNQVRVMILTGRRGVRDIIASGTSGRVAHAGPPLAHVCRWEP